MVLNAEGKAEDNHFRTGTLTTESIKNHSDIEVKTISAGVSTDTTQMAGYAMSAALSLLGNQSEHETSTTDAAISRNMSIEITDEKAQQQKTGKGDIIKP